MDADVSFSAWFFAGMIAWNFISECFTSNTTVFLEYRYLIQKIKFDVEILPIVKMISNCMIHGVFVLFVATLNLFQQGFAGIYYLQLLYFFICSLVLIVSVSIMLASITVFFKDLKHLTTVIMQLGFWATPVVWSPHLIPEKYRLLLAFNPIYYVVDGYRQSLVYQAPFWKEGLFSTLVFWSMTIIFILISKKVFRGLRPQFADEI